MHLKKWLPRLLVVLSFTVVTSCSTMADIWDGITSGFAPSSPAVTDSVSNDEGSSDNVMNATVIYDGQYNNTASFGELKADVYQGDFIVWNGPAMSARGKYEVKNTVVYIAGEASDFSWDGNTLSYKGVALMLIDNGVL